MLTEKQQALNRRANMLIARLQRPDYAVYAGHESTEQLAKLIKLIVWALERSMRRDQWEPFRQEFLNSRYILLDVFINEQQEQTNYLTALEEVVNTLHSYREYVVANDVSVVYED